ncbi:MAG: hypothetical protein WA624_11975, partial [Methylocella sp.]
RHLDSQKTAHGPPSLFLQLLTVLAEKPPASAGYRGSDLVPWRKAEIQPETLLRKEHDCAVQQIRIGRAPDARQRQFP